VSSSRKAWYLKMPGLGEVAKNPAGKSGEKFYDNSSGVYPVAGEISGSLTDAISWSGIEKPSRVIFKESLVLEDAGPRRTGADDLSSWSEGLFWYYPSCEEPRRQIWREVL
jgi:hypothetical protein